MSLEHSPVTTGMDRVLLTIVLHLMRYLIEFQNSVLATLFHGYLITA